MLLACAAVLPQPSRQLTVRRGARAPAGRGPLPGYALGFGPMDRIPSDLAALTVLDVAGKALRFGSLWADRPAVLVFLRHFG